MAKFSDKRMGKEVGNAAVYAEPHTMTGKSVGVEPNTGKLPNRSESKSVNMSVCNIIKFACNQPVKTDGIKMRGTGCATKGVMSRGPMA